MTKPVAAQSEQPAWRADLSHAFDLMKTAEMFADDGAYLTAAKRLEEAAAKFRSGHMARLKAFGLEA